MTWWQALPALITAAALLMVPGLLLARSLGARGIMAWAMAPVASCGLVGAAAIIGGLLGLPWSIMVLGGVTVLASLLAVVLRRAFRRQLNPVAVGPRGHWLGLAPMVASLLLAALLIGRWLVYSIGQPNSFSQAYDNVFHLNAIRYIVQTGNASSLTLGQMLNPDKALAIYPSAWHSFCALIVEVANVNVFVAENALTMAVCALVWPLACIILVRTLLGPHALAIIAAGVLAASFWAFPFQLVQRGPLFPNVLSYAILPLCVVVVAGLFGLLHERLMDKFTLTAMLLVGATALFTAQPNGFTALMVVSLPILVGSWSRIFVRLLRQKAGPAHIMAIVAGGFAGAALFALMWHALVIPFYEWQPSRTVSEAAMDVVSGGLLGGSPTWIASALAAAGVITVLVRRRGYWMVASFALVGGLYIASAAIPSSPWRNILVGSWYEDTPRLAALVPMFTLLLAAKGVVGLSDATAKAVQAVSSASRRGSAFESSTFTQTTVPAVAGCIVLSAMAVFPMFEHRESPQAQLLTPPLSQAWGSGGGTTWITPDEYQLMSRLSEEVPADAVIAVNPFNGGSLAYAVSGRQVSQYQLTSKPGQDLSLIARNLSTAVPGSLTCKMAAAANIRYILDFGTSYLGQYDAAHRYPGFVNVGHSPRVELVDSQGSAKLYKINGC